MIKQYDKYKVSGIEWVGEIPDHWRKLKIGRSFNKIGSGTTPKSGSDIYYENGNINWLNTGDLNDSYITETNKKITEAALNEFSTLKLFPKNSIVIALYGATIGKLGQLQIETTTNQACCVLSDSEDIENRYLFYFLLSAREFIISKAYGGGQPNISQDLIKQLYISAPTKTEQRQIVQYLDHQTAIIDQLIQQKEKLIELLKEKRQAVINEAVTKGLNPKSKMKDSGIEWLGEVPENWEIKRLGFISDLFTGFPWKSELFDFENGIKIVRGENVSEGFLRWGERTRFWNIEVENDSKYFLKENDIIIAMDGSKVGKNYVLINPTDLPLLLHQRMCRVRVNENNIPKFISYYIGSDMFRYYIDISKTDPMVPHITQKNIFDFQIAIPSKEEQLDIIAHLDNRIQIIDHVSFNEEQHIEKLKEYRQSIISEAVTGKIDVRDWQLNKNK
jgi:type I restriction enzyme S subunit